jgi:lysophospholipase L1-like esterase
LRFLDDGQDVRGTLVGAGFDRNHRVLTGSMGKRVNLMRSRVAVTLSIAAGFVAFVTSAWTINEVGKNNRAIHLLSERTREIAGEFEALDTKIDRLKPGTVGHEHSVVREFVIAAHLARAESPIVFLGDSITEAAVLPNAICGHPVINAGIGGAGVDQLLKVAPALLKGKSPALVVLAIGTNDAYATPGQEQRFSASYIKLLQSLGPITPKVVVANIPPVDPKGGLTVATGIDPGLIDRLNLALPKIAEDAGASLVDLNKAVGAKGAAETIDGVHLSPRAYDLWDAAIFRGITRALDCSAKVAR